MMETVGWDIWKEEQRDKKWDRELGDEREEVRNR